MKYLADITIGSNGPTVVAKECETHGDAMTFITYAGRDIAEQVKSEWIHSFPGDGVELIDFGSKRYFGRVTEMPYRI